MLTTIVAQGLGGLFMAGGLYAGAAVLCEVNTFHDIQTSISASGSETPILLGIAGFIGYSVRNKGPPLIAIPGAMIGGALTTGAIIAAWEYAGGYMRLHQHTNEQKRKHTAGLALAGALAAAAGTAAERINLTGRVPMQTVLTGDAPGMYDLD